MAKSVTLAHFLFCETQVQHTCKPSLELLRTLVARCKVHYLNAPKQFISRHLYLQLCWQTIYAYCYWFTTGQSTINPLHLRLNLHGAYCRGFTLINAPLTSKAQQYKALTHYFTQVGEWVNTDYALGHKEQGRLLLDLLSAAFERAHHLALANTTHINHCHTQLHTLICQQFFLNEVLSDSTMRLTCCRYYLAGYNKCQNCPKKDSKKNEPTSQND